MEVYREIEQTEQGYLITRYLIKSPQPLVIFTIITLDSEVICVQTADNIPTENLVLEEAIPAFK